MGRVVSQDALLDVLEDRKLQFKLDIIRDELGLSESAFLDRSRALLHILPGLEKRLLQLQSKLIAGLLTDVDQVAARLIELKLLLPRCDVGGIVISRPSLVLEPEWRLVAAAVRDLDSLLDSPDDVAAVVQRQPVVLAQDVPALITELERLLPDADVKAVMQTPGNSILTMVMNNEGLSIW